MTRRLNDAVKRRGAFRPFAPAVPVESAAEWFDLDRPAPYMLMTAPVREEHRHVGAEVRSGGFADRLGAARSAISAATHVDHSARVQTVDAEVNAGFHALLRAFEIRSGCPVLLNTSFNRRDEPIVGTPADAWRCFVDTDLDLLVLEDCVVRKSQLEKTGEAA